SIDLATRPPQAKVASTGLVGNKHSRPKVYEPLLTKSLAHTGRTYVCISVTGRCLMPLASKVTTTTPVGEKTVAVAVTNTGKPLPVCFSVTSSSAFSSLSLHAALPISSIDLATRPPQAKVASTGLVGNKHSRPKVYEPLLTKSLA